MSDSFVEDVNKKIAMMWKNNSLVYMDNANIPKSCLITDGLHLAEKAKWFDTRFTNIAQFKIEISTKSFVWIFKY